mgnify:CR=1 FL=1
MEKEKLLLEITGYIVKEELVKDLNNFDFGDVAVFEVENYYPGYYRGLIYDEKPNFIYIKTTEYYSYETIKRVERNLKSQFDFPFDLAFASLNLFNEDTPCIRVKYLNTFDDLKKLMTALKQTELKLAKLDRTFQDKAIIKTDKVFLLDQVEDSIFMDMEERENGYIILPKHMSWKEFEKLSLTVKYNWDGQSFDAAQGIFKRHQGIQDVARIYTKGNSEEFMKEVLKAYQRR